MSINLSERFAVVATIDPGAILDNGNSTSDWVDMSKFGKMAFVVEVGFTDTTVDAIVLEGTTSSGGSTATLKSATQLTSSDGNKQIVLEVDADELTPGKRYVACKVTAGNGTSGAYVSVLGLAGDSKYEPASEYDLASVAEIVA